jgi:polysaccharide pyruvyl transferase WcaK-like protein
VGIVNRDGRGRKRGRLTQPPRVGLFGLLGSGNLGNDASFEVVLNGIRTRRPDAVFDAMCSGPEELTARYGIESTSSLPYKRYEQRTRGLASFAIRGIGKVVVAFETLRWVRRHDVVIVPGAGALEATLPVQPWGTPYGLFLVCAAGRIFRTKVALVNVGANVMNQRVTRRLQNAAARLAYYRSYRDEFSREAMRRRGLDVSRDGVFPDLVFGLGTLAPAGDARTAGVGVMEYRGTNDDHRQAEALRAGYVARMTAFVGWLLDQQRAVRVLVGDVNGCDDSVASEIVAGVLALRPDLEPARLTIRSLARPSDLLEEMAVAGVVVATRYHNVVSALSLAKPTISIGYSTKHDVVMADMGLAEFCQSVRALDVERLKEQFLELERRAPEVRQNLATRSEAHRHLLGEQFDQLCRTLFSSHAAQPLANRAAPQRGERAASLPS